MSDLEYATQMNIWGYAFLRIQEKPDSKTSMPKKKVTPNTTASLPLGSANGVAPLEIPAITKAVTKYERAKEKRCQASPAEITAKAELQAALHKHSDQLPKNSDGFKFYRLDDVDYTLTETLTRKRASSGEDAEGGGDE